MNTRTIFVVVRGADLYAETLAVYANERAAQDRALKIIEDMRDDCALDFDVKYSSPKETIQQWNDWWETEPDMHLFVNSVPLFE